jgi:transposase
MIMSAEPESSTQRAGRTPGASSSKAVKLNPKDQTSIRIVAQMDELFAIDEKARKQNLNPSDRHLLRLEKAKPLLEEIKTAIQAARSDALPKNALAKACNYTLTLWQRLIRFLDYPVLELSNNLAENAIRPVALGRRYEQSEIRRSLKRAKREFR